MELLPGLLGSADVRPRHGSNPKRAWVGQTLRMTAQRRMAYPCEPSTYQATYGNIQLIPDLISLLAGS
jgi:hypothetical protein